MFCSKYTKKLFLEQKLNEKLLRLMCPFFPFRNYRTPRNKRQAETGNEGSGEDDYDDEYYDNDDEYVCANNLLSFFCRVVILSFIFLVIFRIINSTAITEIAQPESHPHRHQHGYEKVSVFIDISASFDEPKQTRYSLFNSFPIIVSDAKELILVFVTFF